ncbi:unnamed protein product [Effrenium voratum]|nr:unnamed protein product [Effrenium voratum]
MGFFRSKCILKKRLKQPFQPTEQGSIRSMGRSEDNWFDLAKLAWSENAWTVQLKESHGSVSHCPCPWGGYLLKLHFDHVHVPSCCQVDSLLIRPELRHLARKELKVQQYLAPGDAVLRGSGDAIEGDKYEREAMRRFVTLFGNLTAPFFRTLDQTKGDETLAVRQQRRVNFPELGDVTGLFRARSPQREALAVARSDGENTFRICLIFNVPVYVSAHWVPECLQLVLKVLRQALIRNLNGPHLADLRKEDQEFYVVLSLRHFKRGPPMLPHAGPSEPDVCISTDRGPSAWSRFGPEPFQAARYLQLFLERLGHEAEVFDCLDGRKLVPYKCALRRDVWRRIRGDLEQAFSLQKTAYRRANGGTQAPELREDSTNLRQLPWRAGDLVKVPLAPQLVVRRTFIDVEEGFHQGSTRVPPGFPRGSARAAGWCEHKKEHSMPGNHLSLFVVS